jgi:hypothetical protein
MFIVWRLVEIAIPHRKMKWTATNGAKTESAMPTSAQIPSQITIHAPPDWYMANRTGSARTAPRTSLIAKVAMPTVPAAGK